MVRVKGGNREEVSDAGCADGATVEVRNIFFNTPARLKFMRSVSTETGHISDTVTRLALAYPSVRFRLYNNDALMLETSLKADLKIRAADIFGRDFLKDILPVEGGDSLLKIHGFIAKPEIVYSTTKGFFIYVNNRWIRDRGINHAIVNGYRSVLASSALGGSGGGKYPFVVLFIDIAPQHVDVNVHPTKCEVRFKNPKDIYQVMKNSIEATLAPSYASFGKSFNPPLIPPLVKGGEGGLSSRGGIDGNWGEGVKENTARYEASPPSPARGFEISSQPSQQVEFAETTPRLKHSGTSFDNKALFFEELEVIGQLWSEYLLCQREDEFYIVDQHAAAERVAFEKLKKDYYVSRRVNGQMLLLPQRVEVSLQERDAMEGSLPVLTNLGFDIEPFGSNTFIIRSVPDMLSGMDCKGLIQDLLDELVSSEMSFRIEDKLDNILMRIACHSVIRGKRPLSSGEAKALLKGLAQTDFSGNCPHGRPVIKTISRFEIEKMFKRR